ncbi:LysR family transcriptional regulator [Pelistega suis]|uniref:LysR family transcriptional regulator n=1 Tax=Pelistega suis TaxID=1631957 RepID=A0A849P7G2_9BURK|nr:LysR family transcriptional regulator [Pelistega suis]NOL51722.1 LysR family transcriptional regulator [Pelistega suis]
MPKNFHKIDLNDMRLFVSVVQAGSLTRASELLDVPKSHLSRHLTELENSLGTTLMDRGRRGIVLNELGRRFLHNAQEMLRLAQMAIDDIQTNLQKPNGLLRMSVSTEVGRGFLMHHLPAYFKRYPDVNVEVQIDNRKVNMIQDGIDIALRVGSINNDNVVARKLFDLELGVFASPGYLAQYGIPQTPHELYGHQLLYKYDGPEWAFQKEQHRVVIDGQHKLRTNDFNLIAQMVSEGLGIAVLPCFDNMIKEDWIKILPEWTLETVPVYVVYYKNRGATSVVRSMVDFLLDIPQKT